MENKTKILTFAAVALMFAVCFIGFVAINDGEVDAEGTTTNVAKIGDTKYSTLADAVAYVHMLDDTKRMAGTEIILLRNAEGSAIPIGYKNLVGGTTSDNSPVKLTIDLNGFTYTVTKPTVGSSGTETNGFQMLKDSYVTIKNGTLTSSGNSVKILVQNYCNLTLDNVTLDGSNLHGSKMYVLSNNYGDVIINDSTIKAKEGDVAFDVCGYSSYGSHNVTVNGSTIIQGDIELSGDEKERTMNLIINNIKLEGKISDLNPGKVIVTINGGSFSNLSGLAYVAEGKTYNLVSDCVISSNVVVKANTTLNIGKDVTVTNNDKIVNNGMLTNNGTIKMTGESNIAGGKKVVNNGIVIDERAEDKPAVPITNDGTVVAKNNADKYKEAKVDVVEQDPDKPVATEGKIEVNTNKYAFITPITTTGKLDIVLNDGYKQYTVTIPEGTVIAAGTVISVSFIEYQSDSVTRYQINTPGIENFSMKLPCQIGFKKAKVYCDDSELGVSKVRYDAGTGYVTFDASHNSVFTIVLSNTSHTGATTVSGGDASNDYSLVIAITVLVASLGFLAYVIKKR